MKIVVDTSILIDHLRNGPAWRLFLGTVDKEIIQFFLPTIVLYELFSGKSSQEPQIKYKIENLVRSFQRIGLTEKIARRAGELCRDSAYTIQAQDYIIAASA